MSLTNVNNGSWRGQAPKTVALVLLLAVGYAYSGTNAGSLVAKQQAAIDPEGSSSEPPSGTAAGAASITAAPVIDPEVRQVLARACGELASARTVSYHAEINFDSVLSSGVKLQYAAEMDTAIWRPNRLAISYKSDLGGKAIWYNGTTLTIYDPAHRVYASTAAPDSIDAMLTQVADEKNLSIPLEGFDFSNPCKRAYGNIQRAKYVGINDVSGVACDHLAFIQPNADWQLWIDHGKTALPRKIVIVHKNVPSQPQWAAVFSNWRFNHQLPASLFQPRIPKGATKASFAGAQENQQ